MSILRVALLACLLAASAALARDEPPEVDDHGLHLVHNSELRVVYQRPGTDFTRYSKVILVDAYVAFRKNWERDHRHGTLFRLNKDDIQQIKQRVGDVFHKTLTEELERKGIRVVDAAQADDDVLIVRPAIINLDMEAPDKMDPMAHTISASSGSMTLYAELYDSVSSQMIGRVVDPQTDRGFGGQFMAQNRVTNQAAEERIVREWADVMASHLHAVKN